MTDAANPALSKWDGPNGLPRFERIADGDYADGFEAALAAHIAEIEAIAGNDAAPDFDNTVVALELSGQALERVSSLFWNRAGADTNAVIQALERDIAPKLSRHYSWLGTHAALFARIDTLWQQRAALSLTVEQERVLERLWKGFVKAGARLEKPQQQRLAAINERLAALGARFGQNVLADESGWALFLEDEAELAGLPPFLREAMAAAARERSRDGSFAVTLSRSIIEPFLTFSTRRDLREQAFRAWAARGANGGETDNAAIVTETLALRAEKAKLLGYPHFAAYKLDDSMAGNADAVNALLRKVWEKAREKALAEEADLAALIASEGANHPVKPWDWRHYAEKRRQQLFDFSEADVKPYLQLENIIAACFDVAGRLFGLRFEEVAGFEAWHPDVRLFEVRDAAGDLKALFLGDYFARSSKRSGAWMSSLQSQHRLAQADGGKGALPIVYNICNFAKPASGQPALLSFDDARTLFHEFGHALHGMLSDVTYPSVSGTAVSRDFVELPSQLYEHWLTVPEVLEKYARHDRTGEPIPRVLLDRLLAARNFNAGFATVEYTSSALVDIDLHQLGAVADPLAVQGDILKEIGMPDAITMRHAVPHFQHVFSGEGYAAGYYAYIWSEVLDADAFSAFEEAGDAFDPETAARLKAHVYSAGGAVDPKVTYNAFRGKLPEPDAMLRKRGLI